MTIQIQRAKTNRKFTGLATDQKPILTLGDVGDTFYETDTKIKYDWLGKSWSATSMDGRPLASPLTFETDIVTELMSIAKKLDVLIEYEALMHKVHLGDIN